MRPVRLRPHPAFLPRPGAKRVRYADIAGWALRPLPAYRDDRHWGARAEGPEDVSSGELQAFLIEHPEVSTRSAKIQRCLAYLARFRPARDA